MTLAIENVFVVYGVWMESQFGLSVTALGLASTVIAVAEFIAESTSAGLVDRIGKRRAVLGGLALNLAAYLLLPRISASLPGALAGTSLLFLSFEFSIVSILPLISEAGARGAGDRDGAECRCHIVWACDCLSVRAAFVGGRRVAVQHDVFGGRRAGGHPALRIGNPREKVWSWGYLGKSILKVVPWPNTLATAIRPPCAWTSWRAMASPSPLPVPTAVGVPCAPAGASAIAKHPFGIGTVGRPDAVTASSIGAPEPIEDEGKVFGPDAFAGVGDGDAHARRRGDRLGAECDRPAVWRVLQGVAHQVAEHLVQPAGIARDFQRA